MIDWDFIKKITLEVSAWPDWKKEGLNIIDPNTPPPAEPDPED